MITKEVSRRITCQGEIEGGRNWLWYKTKVSDLKDKGIVVCHVWTAQLSWFHPFIKVQNPFSARRSSFLLLILLGTCSVEIFGPSLPSDVGVCRDSRPAY